MSEEDFQIAWRALQSGNHAEAAGLYGDILKAHPKHFDALYLLGFCHFQGGKFSEAETAFGAAFQVNPASAETLIARGSALRNLQRYDEALACFDGALALNPRAVDAAFNRGAVLLQAGRLEEALSSFDATLAQKPDYGEAHLHRAFALLELRRLEESVQAYDKALALAQGDFAGWTNRATALLELGRAREALASVDRALALAPLTVAAWGLRAEALTALGRRDEAQASFARGLAIAPDAVDIMAVRGRGLYGSGLFDGAERDYERILALDPGNRKAKPFLVHWRLNACDWRFLAEDRAAIASDAWAGEHDAPFLNFFVPQSPADQLRRARAYIERRHPPAAVPLWRGAIYRHGRIKLAYLSGDFRDHATGVLAAGLFEHHDRSRFETVALSFGVDEKSEMRERLKRGFEHFIDVREKSDGEIAAQLRRMEVDIAVDVMGLQGQRRTGIFAARPAPVQVSYLAFPGTMGAPYIDYLIADGTVVPPGEEIHYSEKIVRLPDTYQPTDSMRTGVVQNGSRAGYGLPAEGFVFCAFHAAPKINPEIFGIWMRLLAAVPGSVLWLLEDFPALARNLRREAGARGIAEERLIFAPRVAHGEYLARLGFADLFLDTLPCCAHTTASDVLWAGLPLLTATGETFAGRVAASVLGAAGLSELIADSLAGYEAMALALARDAAGLARLRAKLASNRQTHPLFDTARYTRNLEAAFIAMWDRAQKGEAPLGFAV